MKTVSISLLCHPVIVIIVPSQNSFWFLFLNACLQGMCELREVATCIAFAGKHVWLECSS